MNLGALRVQTRYYLDDNSAVRWSDVEVDSYINQAYENYYNKLVTKSYEGLLTTPVLLNITGGVNEIPLPVDFFQGKILYRVLPDKKVPCTYKSPYDGTVITNYTTAFYRPGYSFVGMNLLLDPTPSDTETGALELHYWPQIQCLQTGQTVPTAGYMVNDTDSPVAGFNAQWHQLLPLWAAYQAKSLREEEDVVNIQTILGVKEGPFNDMLEKMVIARVRTEPFNTDSESGYNL